MHDQLKVTFIKTIGSVLPEQKQTKEVFILHSMAILSNFACAKLNKRSLTISLSNSRYITQKKERKLQGKLNQASMYHFCKHYGCLQMISSKITCKQSCCFLMKPAVPFCPQDTASIFFPFIFFFILFEEKIQLDLALQTWLCAVFRNTHTRTMNDLFSNIL